MFSRRFGLGTGAAITVLALSLTSCGPSSSADDATSKQSTNVDSVAAPAQQSSTGDFAAPVQNLPVGATAEDSSQGPHSTPVPGLGPETSAQIPAETTQVLVASAPSAKSDSNTLTFYEYEAKKWTKVKTFKAHNGSNGWLADRREGDKTTPIGVFTLSDAGGNKANPGTKLPYSQDTQLPSSATVAYGSEYSRVFDYILAIDYNRQPGKAPTDKTRPLGWNKGGGIWLHLDHDSGTNGCVTIKEKDIKWILRNLDPKAHPRIAMGPAEDLAQ